MIYSERRTLDISIVPTLEIQGDRLMVALDLLQSVTSLTGPQPTGRLPIQRRLSQRIYRLDEFSHEKSFLKYLLVHDRENRLLDPVNAYERFGKNSHAGFLAGPPEKFVIAALYQAQPVRDFHGMDFAVSRPVVMDGPVEFFDSSMKHLLSFVLMPERYREAPLSATDRA